MMPHEFPAWKTVYDYFRLWRTAGVWQQMNQALREMLRRRAGRESTPRAAIVEAPVSEDNLCGTSGRLRWSLR